MAAQNLPFLPGTIESGANLFGSEKMDNDVQELLDSEKVPSDGPEIKMSSRVDDRKVIHVLTRLDIPGQAEPNFEQEFHKLNDFAPGTEEKTVLTTERGRLELLPGEDKSHWPDCIPVPKDWPDFLLKQSHKGQDRAWVTSGTCESFQEYRNGGKAGREGKDKGVAMIEGLLRQLYNNNNNMDPKLKIKVLPPKDEEEASLWKQLQFWKDDIDTVSNVTALLLVIRLRSDNDTLFGWLVGLAPPAVIVELAALKKGTLINSGMINRALKNITKTLATPVRNAPRDFVKKLADAGGNLLASYFRNYKGRDQRAMEQLFGDLVRKIQGWIDSGERTLSINRTAVAYGLVFSGMIKYTQEIAKKHKEDQKKAEMAISVTLGLLGFAGHGADQAASIANIVSAELMKAFWKDPSSKFTDLVNELVNGIYIFLWSEKRLWDVPDTEKTIKDMTAAEIYVFRLGFEVILRCNRVIHF